MGLYMAKHKYCISSNVQVPMASAWRIATYLINIMVFTVTGIILAKSFVDVGTTIIAQDFAYSILLYIVIHVGRALTIVILYPLIRRTGVYLSWKDCLVLIWSGLRGSMALILVLIVDLDSRIDSVTRNHFLFHVSMIVLFTLILNGTSSQFLVKFLGLKQGMFKVQNFLQYNILIILGTKESQIVLSQALEYMRRHTSSQLLSMKQDENFSEVDWKMLVEYLPKKLLEEFDEERNPVVSTENDAIVSLNDTGDKCRQNIRNELVIRFLTAMSIDYEKQWYLGMIRRRTLDILIKSVEQAKQKCSFQLHWQLLVKHFRLSFFLFNLLRFDYFDFINKLTNNLLFNHIFLTIELTLGK
jgi:hypothetical protein